MTRGTFYLITDKNFYESIEFNGDMYPEGHGNRAFELLKQVKSSAEFKAMVLQFNKEAHNYEESGIKIFERSLSFLNKQKDMSKDYFAFWFSDWIFIKNASSKPIDFILRNKREYRVEAFRNFQVEFWKVAKIIKEAWRLPIKPLFPFLQIFPNSHDKKRFNNNNEIFR